MNDMANEGEKTESTQPMNMEDMKMEDMRVKPLENGAYLLTMGLRKKVKDKKGNNELLSSYESKEYAFESVDGMMKMMKSALMKHSREHGKGDKMAKYMKD